MRPVLLGAWGGGLDKPDQVLPAREGTAQPDCGGSRGAMQGGACWAQAGSLAPSAR